MTIDILPSDILLDVFDFYVKEEYLREAWHALVHVCQRWRNLVFVSPRRLNLRLVCTSGKQLRETLDVWPIVPIVISISWYTDPPMSDIDNVIAALEHNDRVREVDLRGFNCLQLEKVLSAMQRPFPELTGLTLRWIGGTVPVFPDSFLGGSSPRLQTLQLDGIPSPSLQKLLLFATDIVTLSLGDLSRSVRISPEELVTCLPALTGLRYLSFKFVSLPFFPDQGSRHPPSPTYVVLPSLTRLSFEGVSEYLMDLVARVNAPLLDHIFIEFFDEPITDTLPLVQFIGRTPTFKTFDEARVLI